jgi:hypothetical protein
MTSSIVRPRHAIALVSALFVGVGLGIVPAPTQAAGPQSRPQLGFRISLSHHADGAWVGRYRVGHRIGYRTQPRKSNAESGYGPAHRVSHVPGSRRAATRRAAWVLSTYGGTPDRTTAAAVDVAVHALLSRGTWRVGTAYTARRTNATGEGRVIRAFATIMLRQSKHRHGPYRTKLKARRVPAGNQTTVRVKVHNRRGLGPVITSQQRGLAVDIHYPGAGTKTVFLNNHGVGRVFFRAAAGKTRITAAVHAVPDHALFLRRPHNKAASRVALAGHHRTLRRRFTGIGVGTQALAVTNSSASVLVGHPLKGSYSVTGLTGHETVDYAVHGPFGTAATSCTGIARKAAKATIRSNGTHALPRWKPAKTGFYAWQVTARGNSTTRPASACGPAYLTRKDTNTDQSRHGSDRTVKVGHAFGPDIKVSGFDRPEVHTVHTRVYGPFLHKNKTKCTRNRLFRSLPTSIRNDTRWNKTTVVNNVGNTGYYVFQTTLDAGTFMRSSHSGCGDSIRVIR